MEGRPEPCRMSGAGVQFELCQLWMEEHPRLNEAGNHVTRCLL